MRETVRERKKRERERERERVSERERERGTDIRSWREMGMGRQRGTRRQRKAFREK